jgi:hypothetical protein
LSSILKALKKIEEDSPPLQTHPSLPKPIDSKQALNSNTRKRRRLRKLLYLVIALLVIAVATVILFSQRRLIIAKISSVLSSEVPKASEASTPNRSNVYRAKVSTPSAKSTPKPQTTAGRPKKQTNKMVPESRNKKFQASAKSSNRRLQSGSPIPQMPAGTRASEAALNSRAKKPLKKVSPPPGPQPVNSAVAKKDTRSIAPAARAKPPARTKPRVTYDRIDDSKLKLQALAWSDDAARRMAVINGRIVHEGESVDGYQLIKIREEDVVVKGGGKSWLLVFGLQQ